MNLSNYFNISRLWLLLKMELFRSRHAIMMTLVIIFGLLFFVCLLLSNFFEKNRTIYEHHESFAFALLVGGFILSSLAFNDLGRTLNSFRYLTLPVSTLEKLICMWFLTSIGWIVVFTLTYTIYASIADSVGQLLFSHIRFVKFEPLGEYGITAMKSYFVLQGIFLVGAAHFKGYVFPKTVLTLILFAFVCGLIIYIMMSDIFLSEHVCTGEECELVNTMEMHASWQLAKGVFWWGLAPLSWLVAYLGLKEKEA